MVKKILFFISFTLSTASFAADHDGIRNVSDSAEISTALAQHPNIFKLVVGCGKTPYKWEESQGAYCNAWRQTEGTADEGNHAHADAWTLAEDDKVEPNFLLDFTKPMPVELHGKFKIIYLEKLPPHVLNIKQVWQNAYDLLKIGGQLYADNQKCSMLFEGNKEAFIPEDALFTMCLPQDQFSSARNLYTVLQNLKTGEFAALKTVSLSRLEEVLNRSEATKKRIIYGVTLAYMKEHLDPLQKKMLETNLTDLGFSNFKAYVTGGTKANGRPRKVNPFNNRAQEEGGIFVTKDK